MRLQGSCIACIAFLFSGCVLASESRWGYADGLVSPGAVMPPFGTFLFIKNGGGCVRFNLRMYGGVMMEGEGVCLEVVMRVFWQNINGM